MNEWTRYEEMSCMASVYIRALLQMNFDSFLMLVNAVHALWLFDWNASSHAHLYEIVNVEINELAANIWCNLFGYFQTITSNFFKVFGLITTI